MGRSGIFPRILTGALSKILMEIFHIWLQIAWTLRLPSPHSFLQCRSISTNRLRPASLFQLNILIDSCSHWTRLLPSFACWLLTLLSLAWISLSLSLAFWFVNRRELRSHFQPCGYYFLLISFDDVLPSDSDLRKFYRVRIRVQFIIAGKSANFRFGGESVGQWVTVIFLFD